MIDSFHYVYILTNKYKGVLYIGVTVNMSRRLYEHVTGMNPGFAHNYNCRHLVYYEQFEDIELAISREKQLKHWRREKEERLISSFNADWKFLNERFLPSKP